MADDLTLTITLAAKDAASAAFASAGSEAHKLSSSLEEANTAGEHASTGVTHAGEGAEKGGEGAEAAEGKFGKLKESLGEVGKVAAGMVAGGVLQSLTNGLDEQFSDIVGGATKFGAAVYDMGIKVGTSAQDSSTLVAAMQDLQIPVDQGTQAFARFEKGLTAFSTSASGTTTSIGTSAAGLKAMGISATDASGKTKPFMDLISEVADKFKAMPDGADKTALAMQLFGKTGADMIPMLNLGKDGLAEISDEAKKYGLQLSGDNVDAIRKFALAHDQMNMAVEGARLQIGTLLIPILNKLVSGLTEVIAWVVPAVEQFVKTYDVVGNVQSVIATLLPYLTTFASIAKDQLVPALLLAWNGVKELGEAIVDATKFITDHKAVEVVLVGVLATVGLAWAATTAVTIAHGVALAATTIATDAMTAAQAALTLVMDANPIALVILAIAGLAAGLAYAYNTSATFRDTIQGALGDVGAAFNALGTIANDVLGGIEAILGRVSQAAQGLSNFLGSIHAPSISLPGIPGRAAGGPVSAGSLYMVGEHGPELFAPGASGSIIPNGASTGGGGRGVTIVLSGNTLLGNDSQSARALARILKPELDRLVTLGA